MNFFLFAILSVNALFGFGQVINRNDQIEKEKVVDYYDTGEIKEVKYQYEGEFVDSVLVFDKQGILIKKGFFNSNKLSLKDTLGNLILVADYKGELVHGWMKTFYSNGELRSFSEYFLGAKNGVHLIFYENGLLETKEHYQKGILNGVGVSYFETGRLRRYAHFKNGKVSGNFIEYYSNGNLKHQGEYLKSKPVGDHFYYQEDGKLKEKKQYGNNY